jgi:predicted component of type VI protein secretion system
VSGTALALVGIFALPFGRRARVLLRHAEGRQACNFGLVLLLLVGLGGVGLGCSSSTAVTATGTPLGVATLTITASANVNNAVVSQSVYLTVNVVTKGSTTP